MKVVISDTSPINYLVLIGAQDILPSIFDRIIIPQAVYRELNAEASPPEIRQWIAVAPDWLEIRPPTNPPVRILSQLGEGESAAIELAEELKADLLVMDERAGREEALRRGLPVIGTLGILERASERGLLDFAIAFYRIESTQFLRLAGAGPELPRT